NARVIAGLDDHSHDQILHRDPLADFDEHPGTRRTPRFLADGHFVFEHYLSLVERLEYGIRAHDLREACRGQLYVGVVRGKYITGIAVDKHVAFRADNR